MIEAPAHFWDSLADLIDKVPTLFMVWCTVEVFCAAVLRDRSPDAAEIQNQGKRHGDGLVDMLRTFKGQEAEIERALRGEAKP